MDRIKIRSRSDKVLSEPQIIFLSQSKTESIAKTHEVVRKCLLQRQTAFNVLLTNGEANKYARSYKHLPFVLINRACGYKYPFVSNDYDYLWRSVRKISCQIEYTSEYVKIFFSISYLTTLPQENQIDDYLQKLFTDHKAYEISDIYNRIRFAYDFIIAHVRYDNQIRKHSAYDALMERKAVCEGCSLLLYRMLAMFGVPCRIITGRGLRESHAWNIISIGGKWYNADVTWDLFKGVIERKLSLYDYFLVGESHFHQHRRDAEFMTFDFTAQHPMYEGNYVS